MTRIVILLLVSVVLPVPLAAQIYPQLALGGGYEVILFVSNESNFEWNGSIWLRKGAGVAWDTAVTVSKGSIQTAFPGGVGEVDVVLAPRETRRYLITGDSEARAGYLQLLPDLGAENIQVATAYFYHYYVGDLLVDSTGVPGSGNPHDEFLVPVEKTAVASTGIALAPNPMNLMTGFNIVLTLTSSSGVEFGQTTITFEGHTAFFFDQEFANVPDGFIGRLRVEAAHPIHVTALRLESTEGGGFQLTSVPPLRVQ